MVAESSEETVIHGELVIGHEVRSFIPCKNTDAYWVSANSAIMEQLKLAVDEFANPEPYSPVYLQAIGSYQTVNPGEGFAADYAGKIAISKVLNIAPSHPDSCSQVNRTYVLDCSEGEWNRVLRTEFDKAWLFQPGGTVSLARSPDTTTESYAKDEISVSLKESEIELSQGTEKLICRNDRKAAIWEHAKLNGASFRAVGNEPGWVVHVYRGEIIHINADYGETVLELAYTEPVVDAESRTAVWTLDGAKITTKGEPCTDTMSGDRFPVRVQLELNGRQYNGCGRDLY